MANNIAILSNGTINELPIKIKNVIYPCEAIVLEDLAQEILIGTNWLGYYGATFDFKKSILKIPNTKHKKDVIPINFQKIHLDHIRNYPEIKRKEYFHAKDRHLLKPMEQKFIEIKPNLPYMKNDLQKEEFVDARVKRIQNLQVDVMFKGETNKLVRLKKTRKMIK